jgi:hypothetical protein
MLALNGLWVMAEMAQRKLLIDLGPYYNPPLITSRFYRLERTLTARYQPRRNLHGWGRRTY